MKAEAVTNTRLCGGEGGFLCVTRAGRFLRAESGQRDQNTWVSISALFLLVLPRVAEWPLTSHFTFGDTAM